MAKKVRRVRKPSSGPEPAKTDSSAQNRSEERLREEYAYVLQDLRRMFILAAVMFLLLITVNLLL